jgi:hypothetical protein
MNELQFDRLLSAVASAMEMPPQQDFLHAPTFDEAPSAANDNERSWPLIPFPEGWSASC